MPTGYTDILDNTKEDVPLEKFIWRCARAFGSFVMAREEPLDKPIDLDKLFAVDPSYEYKLAFAKENLKNVALYTLDECEELLEKEYREALERRLKSHSETLEIAEKYKRMKKLVSVWKPPTTAHVELKKFMLQQLDTGAPYVEDRGLPEKMSPRDWHNKKMAEAKYEVEYYEKEMKEEERRQKVRRLWVQDLITSIGNPTW